jgi:hypothetical protein
VRLLASVLAASLLSLAPGHGHGRLPAPPRAGASGSAAAPAGGLGPGIADPLSGLIAASPDRSPGLAHVDHQAPASRVRDPARWIIPGREIVIFRPGSGPTAVAAAARAAGGAIRRIPALNAIVVDAPRWPGHRPLASIASARGVLRVEPDVRLSLQDADCTVTSGCLIPNDPGFGSQWYLENDRATHEPSGGGFLGADIDAPLGWALDSGSPAIRIAILDTGIDIHHPDLAARVVGSSTLSGNRGNVMDPVGHGTAVAGVAAAIPNNGMGIAGVAYNASLLNLKTYQDGSRFEGESCSATAEGIVAAVADGARVINVSAGGPLPCTLLQRAVDLAWSRGDVVIASAGNSGATQPMYPAAYRDAISVGATDAYDRPASFSNHGAGWVDLAAPGVGIVVTSPTYPNTLGPERYGVGDGTSFSAPMVSGAAALLFAQGLDNHQVAARLFGDSRRLPSTGSYWRYGLLDVCAAIADGRPLCPRGRPAAGPVIAAARAPSGRYRGRTSQGQTIALSVTGAKRITGLGLRFRMRCGTRSTPTYAITLVDAGHPLGLGQSASVAHVFVDPTGIRYGVSVRFGTSGTVTGRIIATVSNARYGSCSSGTMSFSAHL